MHRTHATRAYSQASSKPSDETNRNRIGCAAKCMQRIVMGLSVWCIWTRWSCRYRPVMCRICDCAKVNMLQLTGRNVRGTAFYRTLLYAAVRMRKRVHALNSDLDLTSASFRFVFSSPPFLCVRCMWNRWFAVKFISHTEDAPIVFNNCTHAPRCSAAQLLHVDVEVYINVANDAKESELGTEPVYVVYEKG